MTYIENVLKRVNTRKRIVLPESEDDRVLVAASKAKSFADIVLVGKVDVINKRKEELNINLDNVVIIDPSTYEKTSELINTLYELRKEKGLSMDEAKDLVLNNSRYFATMLVYAGICDGEVTGASHTSRDTFRSAFQICKPPTGKASAFFIIETNNKELGNDGVVLYADCGLNQNPDASLLADIAGQSGETYKTLIGGEPYIGLLSHSTYGSSVCDDTTKVVEATKLAKERYPEFKIDGELQFDAAIIPSVAASKAPGSVVAGHVNTFVFPDLDAGNLAYKITERLAGAKAYGPLTQGLLRPINDLSRGCSSDDIVGVIAITCLQASKVD